MKKIDNLHIPIIITAVLIAFLSNFGSVITLLEPLTFTQINITNLGYFSMLSFDQTYIENNQWWRLISPIFLHFSFAHLAFNCLWIYILGEKIERIDGSLIFISLVIFTAISSNSLQFFWNGSGLFGGLSGVIYGLIGFCMIIEMDSSRDIYDIPPGLYMFMVIWMILGFLGLLELFGFGSVANFAHLGGLVSGIIFAMILKTINLVVKS
ncbi:MAG: peptidase, S54 family protein [Gammaproteobacteria bacterium]|nr:peptidase, S54 family protein [Gammaproteobacteria bacterium]